MATSFAWFRSKICDGSGQGNYSLLSTLYFLLSIFHFKFTFLGPYTASRSPPDDTRRSGQETAQARHSGNYRDHRLVMRTSEVLLCALVEKM